MPRPFALALLSLTALTLAKIYHDDIAVQLDRCAGGLSRGPCFWVWRARARDELSVVVGAKMGTWTGAASFLRWEIEEGSMWWGGERFVLVWEERGGVGEGEGRREGDGDGDGEGVVWVLYTRDGEEGAGD